MTPETPADLIAEIHAAAAAMVGLATPDPALRP